MDSLIPDIVTQLSARISVGEIDIYNEASIQYELAMLLRQQLPPSWKIQLERNISYFGLEKTDLLKREMDIVIFTPDRMRRHCIELKYPTNGQVPEQMFSACKDIRFLEQLVSSGFGTSYFLMFADNSQFITGREEFGIYRLFRRDRLIKGEVQKPTGSKDAVISLNGEYPVRWVPVQGDLRFLLVPIPGHA